jgi:signal transduction histidine kinase
LGLSVLQDEIHKAGVTTSQKSKNDSMNISHEDNDADDKIMVPLMCNATNKDASQSSMTDITSSTSISNLSAWLELTDEICESAEPSVDVLNDLLNYDKIQMGGFSMEFCVFRVRQLVEEISKEFRLSARKKNIHFTLDNRLLLQPENSCNPTTLLDNVGAENGIDEVVMDSLKIVGDRIRLAQVLRNLVSNSLKFTAVDGAYTCWLVSVSPVADMV